MKEFQQYLDTKGKLKVVRTEALRAGFQGMLAETRLPDYRAGSEASAEENVTGKKTRHC